MFLIGPVRADEGGDMGDPTKCTSEQGVELDPSRCGEPDGEPVAVYMIAFRNANMKVWFLDTRTSFETRKECEQVAKPDERCVVLMGNLPSNVESDQP
jgi:hypothetical protein